jgi:hypothetical protein
LNRPSDSQQTTANGHCDGLFVFSLQDALGEVPKAKFPEVFAQYKGSTGTLLAAAEKEEKYVITWTSPKKQIFELPTGVCWLGYCQGFFGKSHFYGGHFLPNFYSVDSSP